MIIFENMDSELAVGDGRLSRIFKVITEQCTLGTTTGLKRVYSENPSNIPATAYTSNRASKMPLLFRFDIQHIRGH